MTSIVIFAKYIRSRINCLLVRLALCVQALTTACSESAAPDLNLDASQLNGRWYFDIVRTSAPAGTTCSTGGAIVVRFDFVSTGNTATTNSTWTNEPLVPYKYTLTGDLDLDDGSVELSFWNVVMQSGFLVTGAIADDLTFTGQLRDPIPGYSGFVFQGCSYTVTGRKSPDDSIQ